MADTLHPLLATGKEKPDPIDTVDLSVVDFSEDENPLDVSFKAGVEKDPDKTAEIIKTARSINQPEEFVENNFEAAKAADSRPPTAYFDEIVKTNPRVAKFLSRPRNMAVAKDDIENLRKFEDTARMSAAEMWTPPYPNTIPDNNDDWRISDIGKGWRSGDLNVRETMIGWQRLQEQLQTGEWSQFGESDLAAISREQASLPRPPKIAPLFYTAQQLPNWKLMAEYEALRGTQGALVGTGMAAGASLLAGPGAPVAGAVSLPTAFSMGLAVGGRVGAIEAMTKLEGGGAMREYSQMVDLNGKRVNARRAAEVALAVGIFNSGVEYAQAATILATIPGGSKILGLFGKKSLFKGITPGKAAVAAGKRYLMAIGSNVAEELVQETSVVAGGNVLKVGSGQPFPQEDYGAQWRRIASVIPATVQSVGVLSAPGSAVSFAVDAYEMDKAKKAAEVYKKLENASAKLRDRDPVTHQEHVADVVKGTVVENILVDAVQAQTYFQSKNIDMKDVAKELGVSDQLDLAIERGGDLTVPYAVYNAKLGKTPHYAALLDDVRFDDNVPTNRKAQAKAEETARMMQDVGRAKKLADADPVVAEGMRYVYDQAKAKLEATGTYKDEKKLDADAQIFAAVVVNMPERGTMDPKVFFDQMKLKLTTEGGKQPAKGALFQSPIEKKKQGKVANITAELIPSSALGHEITSASPAVRQEFSERQAHIIKGIAELYGAEVEEQGAGTGGYAKAINPNHIFGIKVPKVNGKFDFTIVDNIVRAIQYVTKQDAVPWFRPDYGVGEKTDSFAHAYWFNFGGLISPEQEQAFFDGLRKHLGEDAGYTKMSDGGQIAVINFRDDKTAIPFVDDAKFIKSIVAFSEEYEKQLGIKETTFFKSQGKYGYFHDWKADPEGVGVLEGASGPGVSPDILSGLRSRRALFEAAIEEYSGDNLKIREAFHAERSSLNQANRAQTLTERFKNWFRKSVVTLNGAIGGIPLIMYHGTTKVFQTFKLNDHDIGIHVGTPAQASSRVMDTTEWIYSGMKGKVNVKPVFVRIENPLEMPDIGIWTAYKMKEHLRSVAAMEFSDETDLQVELDKIDAIGDADIKGVRKYLQDKGYDGIKYFNEGESLGGEALYNRESLAAEAYVQKWGPVLEATEISRKSPEWKAFQAAQSERANAQTKNAEYSYIVFDPVQLKSAIANRGTWSNKDRNTLHQAPIKPAALNADAKALEGRAVKKFGLTDDVADSGYILADGRMLNFLRNKEADSFAHDAISSVFTDKDFGAGEKSDADDPQQLFVYRTNAIRTDMAGRDVWIVDASENPPTDAQMAILREAVETRKPKEINMSARVRFEEIQNPTAEDVQRFFRGTSQFQGTPDDPNGFIEFTDQGALIHLLETANASTFVHEMAHFWLKNFSNFVASGEATEKHIADWAAIEKWLGVKDGVITDEQHEKFARGFENYLREGVAPSADLQKAFSRFRKWLTKLYYASTQIDIPLNQEIRDIFDRMLATEAEIAFAKSNMGLDLIPSMEGIDPSVIARLADLREEAHGKAVEQVFQKQMKELKPERLAEYNRELEAARKQAEADVMLIREYQTEEAIRRSTMDTKVAQTAAAKFNDKTLSPDDRTSFRMIAGMQGYSSAQMMATKLLEVLPFAKEVNRRVKFAMAEFAHLKDSNKIKEEVINALATDLQTELLAQERAMFLSLVDEAQGNAREILTRRADAKIEADTAKLKAIDIIAKTPTHKAIAFMPYFTAEREAAMEAYLAAQAGKFEVAADAKRRQMLNHALATEAFRQRQNIMKWRDYLHKTQLKDKELFKREEHFNQVAALLTRFGIERKDYDPKTRTETLLAWSERMISEEAAVNIPDWLMDESITMKAGDLTVDQMRDLIAALKNIQHVANKEKEFYRVMQGATIENTILDLATEAATYNKANPAELIERKRGWLEGLKRFKRGYDSNLRTTENIALKLGGWKDDSLWYRVLIQSAETAGNAESDAMLPMAERYKAILEKHYTEAERADMVDDDEQIFIPELNQSLRKISLVMMALNTGTESNLDRLSESRPVGVEQSVPWDRESVMALLQKQLKTADWNFVQDVWDMIGSLWPQMAEVHKEVTGFTPGKVDSVPFRAIASDGQVLMRGGYFPLKADSRGNLVAEIREKLDQPLYTERNPAFVATTKTGHLKARVAQAKYPVALDISIIQRHIQDAVHDIAWRPTIIDLRRLVNNQGFRDLVLAYASAEDYAALRDWIGSAAVGNQKEQAVLSFWDKTMRAMRTNFTAAVIVLNPKIVFQNVSNIFLYAGSVEGFGWADVISSMATKGLLYDAASISRAKYAEEFRAFVYVKSSFMRDKRALPDASLTQMADAMFGEKHHVRNFFKGAMSAFDELTSIPIWRTAYEKAIAMGKPETESIEWADNIIRRSIGAARKYQTAGIFRGGEVDKIFSTLYGFMSAQKNRWERERGILGQDYVGNSPHFLGYLVAHFVVFAAMSQIMSGNLPDFDDEDKMKRWLKGILLYRFQMEPGINAMASVIADKAFGLNSFGYRPIPAAAGPEKIILAATTAISAARGDAEPKDAAEAISHAVMFGTGKPDQIMNLLWNAFDIAFEDMEPQAGDLLRRRPRAER